MPQYRVYRLNNKHIAGPPVIVVCDNDEDAIKQAKQLIDGHDLELWDGRRFVAILQTHEK